MRVLSILLVLVACSGSADKVPANPNKVSAVAESRKIGELSAGEKKQLCEDLKSFRTRHQLTHDENVRVVCNTQAAVRALGDTSDDVDIQNTCRQTLAACLIKNEKLAVTDMDCNSVEEIQRIDECRDVTIGEINLCTKDQVLWLKKLANADSCADLKKGDSTAKVLNKLSSPSCDVVKNKCKARAPTKDDPRISRALVKLQELTTSMCACKDKACAERVRTAMESWGTEMTNTSSDLRPDLEARQRIGDLLRMYNGCRQKLLPSP